MTIPIKSQGLGGMIACPWAERTRDSRMAKQATETGDLVGGTREHAQRVLKVYGALTALGIIGSFSKDKK